MQGEIKVAIGSVNLKMEDRLRKLLFLYSNKLCDKWTTQKKKEKNMAFNFRSWTGELNSDKNHQGLKDPTTLNLKVPINNYSEAKN